MSSLYCTLADTKATSNEKMYGQPCAVRAAGQYYAKAENVAVSRTLPVEMM